jgi:hypothetical protein
MAVLAALRTTNSTPSQFRTRVLTLAAYIETRWIMLLMLALIWVMVIGRPAKPRHCPLSGWCALVCESNALFGNHARREVQ